MMRFFGKLKTLTGRSAWLSAFTNSRLAAVRALLRAKADPSARLRGRYRALDFTFRGRDLSALQEVLTAQEYAFLRPTLQKDKPCILDIGAHIGLFSLWALHENPAASVLSVEASPGTFAVLNDNVEKARTRNSDWRALHRAACDGDRVVRLSDDTKETMSHRLARDGTVEVQGITLRALLDAMGGRRIDIMKVDIEGSEEMFLCADPAALDAIDALAIELHPKLCDTARVEAVLRDNFPVIETIGGRQSSKPLLLCRRAAHG